MTEPPPPTTATTHRPGSAEKLQVMTDRLAAGVQLHHPDDVTCRIDPNEYRSIAFRFGDCIEPEKGADFE